MQHGGFGFGMGGRAGDFPLVLADLSVVVLIEAPQQARLVALPLRQDFLSPLVDGAEFSVRAQLPPSRRAGNPA
jgi:hypothetical protein